MRAQGCEIDGLARFKQLRVDGRARRHDAHDFAAHQLLRPGSVFGLLADRHAIAFADEFGDVICRGVMGHAAHGNWIAAFFVPRRQCDL